MTLDLIQVMLAKGVQVLFLLSLLVLQVPALEARAQGEIPTLTIYTYDSFMAKGGAGLELLPLFEKTCACKVKALPSGDSAQLLSRMQLDATRGKSDAQLAIGLDQHLWDRAKPLVEMWKDDNAEWMPKGYGSIPRALRVGSGFLPFDHGAFSLIAHRPRLEAKGIVFPGDGVVSLEWLLQPALARNLLLEDPRTSSPGLAFLLLTRRVFGDRWSDYWKRLRTQWLTLAPGWDAAYSLFLKGEAPLVWSYVTSQSYHREQGQGDYRALLFSEGQPVQIEGAVLIRAGLEGDGARIRPLARRFLEFLLTPDAQRILATRNWMMPVIPGVQGLPKGHSSLPEPRKIWAEGEKNISSILKDWAAVVGSVR